MNGKITYEEIVYAKNLIGLIKKFIKENEVDDKDHVEAMNNCINVLIVAYKDYRKIENKDNFNFVFRERVRSLKVIYGNLLRGVNMKVRVCKNDNESSIKHKKEKYKRLSNVSVEKGELVDLL
jgi:hypothetical protein